MENDILGKDKTGFKPYINDKEIYFNQRWLLIIGQKNKCVDKLSKEQVTNNSCPLNRRI